MLDRIGKKLKAAEVVLRTSWGHDISTPKRRRQAYWHFQIMDHAFLRKIWTNFFEVAPGVYRSNQPDRARLGKLKAMGFKTVVNLRGIHQQSHYLFEEEACRDLGLTMVNLQLHARSPVKKNELLALFETFRTAERPFVMHCKSGADRAGLASALYLIAEEGKSVAEARRQLGLKYVHLKWSKTGICDHMLDVYEARLREGPISIEDWVRTEYSRESLSESYARARARRAAGT